MNPGPRFQCRLCKNYCKVSEKVVECENCEKRFHASCAKLGDDELSKLESDNGFGIVQIAKPAVVYAVVLY